jgi:hypothetical protein
MGSSIMLLPSHIPPPPPGESWEAKCLCGWWGGRDAGFAHQREFRCTVTFRSPVTPAPIAVGQAHRVGASGPDEISTEENDVA